jgi:hypothetical protein
VLGVGEVLHPVDTGSEAPYSITAKKRRAARQPSQSQPALYRKSHTAATAKSPKGITIQA